eukprot:1144270-Pelagomonas_calceolata.AAC.3
MLVPPLLLLWKSHCEGQEAIKLVMRESRGAGIGQQSRGAGMGQGHRLIAQGRHGTVRAPAKRQVLPPNMKSPTLNMKAKTLKIVMKPTVNTTSMQNCE